MSTSELYPDFKTIMHGDVEVPLSRKYRTADQAAITDADIVAYCTQGPQLARPAITASEGSDLDAYWYDAGVWRHCQTGETWTWQEAGNATSDATDSLVGRINAAQGYEPRAVDEAVLLGSVADALGLSEHQQSEAA